MDVYQTLKDYYATDSRVTVSDGKGAQGIKIKIKSKEKMIIMFMKGDLLLQMPPESVKELIQADKGSAYKLSSGRIMKDRILIPASKKRSWKNLCEQAIDESDNL